MEMKNIVNVGGFKIEAQKETELSSSHKHNKSTAIYGTISSGKEPENQLNNTYTMKDKKATCRQVGETEMWSCKKPHQGTAIHSQEGSHSTEPIPEK